MSFTLRIRNAPTLARYWWAEYSSGSVYSGWLDKTEMWNCPYGAYGKTDLRILVASENFNIMIDQSGLGPIYDDKDYAFDCSNGALIDITPPPPPPPEEESPAISTISPSPCYLGAILTINGSKFAPSLSYNAVYFQKGILLVSRLPSFASETQLVVDLSQSTTLSDPTNAGIWQLWVERLSDNKSSNHVSLEFQAPPPTECTAGDLKCVGYDLYACDGVGHWVLAEENSTSCGYIPPGPGRAEACITVVDDKLNPLSGVRVLLDSYSGITDDLGKAVIVNIPVGIYTLKASKNGYSSYSGKITLTEGKNYFTIELRKAFPWLWVAAGGAAVAAIILLAPAKKKEEIRKKT